MTLKKPLSVQGTFSEGIKLYFKNLELILFIDAISLLPTFLYQFKTYGNPDAQPNFLLSLFVIFLSLINFGAVFMALKKRHEGKETDVWDAVKEGFRLIPRVFSVGLMNALIVIGGLILLVVPGVYWAIKYMFAMQAAIFEDKKLSPFKISGLITKGNMGYAFMAVFGAYFMVMIPYYIVIFITKGNFILYMLIGLPVAFLTTIAQAVHFTAYTKLRETAEDKIEPDSAELKGMGTISGCLIGAAGLAVIISVMIGIGIFAVTKMDLDGMIRKVFGEEVQLSGNVSVKLQDGWISIPEKKHYETYVLIKFAKDGAGHIAVLRSVKLDNPVLNGLKPGAGYDEVITAVENVEKDYLKKTGKPDEAPEWDSFDTFKPVKKGFVWNKLLLYQSQKAPYKTAVMYYTLTDTELVYFYINTDQSDKEVDKAEKGTEEILDMTDKTLKDEKDGK